MSQNYEQLLENVSGKLLPDQRKNIESLLFRYALTQKCLDIFWPTAEV